MIGLKLYGGLGDAFIKIHDTTVYESLERLAPGERATVCIISHNPFVREIFRWHPKASQIDIHVAGRFFHEYENLDVRRREGLPQVEIDEGGPRVKRPVTFYPSPEDREHLAALPKRFLAIAPSASGMEIENRNIPDRIVNIAVGLAMSRNIPVVFLGRTYQGPHRHKNPPSRPKGPGIIDLTDKLSVPGTAEVVRRCTGILSAHSCLLQLSWYHRKPNFAVYPEKYKYHDFDHPSPFGWGKDFPETTRMLFETFTAKAFSRFIKTTFHASKLLIAIPTLSRADLLIRNKAFLESIQAPDEVLILDNGNQSIDINVPIERSPQNLGVSGSWNFFMRRAFEQRDFDGLVLLQDDIIWGQPNLRSAHLLLDEHPDVDLFLAYHQFSIQVHRRSNLQTVGLYDERFHPAYCEDDDYAMTMTQKRRIYQRFHELDPLPGSQTEGTFKGSDLGLANTRKLLDKWGPTAVRINVPSDPRYVSNRSLLST